MKFEGDLPPNRLDHSMCVWPWTVQADGDGNSSGTSDTNHLAFVFGGMDTEGVLHNDCVVTVLTWWSWFNNDLCHNKMSKKSIVLFYKMYTNFFFYQTFISMYFQKYNDQIQ